MSPHGIVDRPGPFCTIQDLGRRTGRRAGLAPGGAMDQRAYLWASRLLGNDPTAAALEITLSGFALRFGVATVVAVTGAGCAATLDGVETGAWRTLRARPGQLLRLGYGSSGRSAGRTARVAGPMHPSGRATALARTRPLVSGPACVRRTDSAGRRFAVVTAGRRLRVAGVFACRPEAGVRRDMDFGSCERPHGVPPDRSHPDHRSARPRLDTPRGRHRSGNRRWPPAGVHAGPPDDRGLREARFRRSDCSRRARAGPARHICPIRPCRARCTPERARPAGVVLWGRPLPPVRSPVS